jgi:hypothetical protein
MPKTTYDKKTGAKTVLDKNGKTVYNKDGSKVTYNSKGKTTYFTDGTKQVLDKKGKTVYFKDGTKQVLDKKGRTEYDKSGKNLTEAARLEKKAADKKVVAKEPSKTVSQIWKERTGTDWSEAKKQGLSDGSAKSNLDLLKKLNSGSLDKDKQPPAKMEPIKVSSIKIPYTGPKELAMTAEQKMYADIDKLNKEKKKKGGAIKKMYKTGGMVNSNSKITASKKTTGKVGGITKAISKVVVKTTSPKGRVGGTSKAPKKAIPKAMYGMSVKKMGSGGMTKKKK